MFVFGKHYSGGVCEVYQSVLHKIIPYLLVIARTPEGVTVVDSDGVTYQGDAILIKPMVDHKFLMDTGEALHLFLAPYSDFADKLGDLVGDAEIAQLPVDALPFSHKTSNKQIFRILDDVMLKISTKIDSRLATALDDVEESVPSVSLVEIANRCDISPSRLRVIAKQELGVSLSALLVWRKLVNAMKILSSGSSLSEAASEGGFSDQAHFTRTMRRVFGITPADSMKALNYEN